MKSTRKKNETEKKTSKKKAKPRGNARDNPGATTAAHKKNLVLYLADPEEGFVKRSKYPEILGITRDTLYYHFSPLDLTDIEKEAFEIRKAALTHQIASVYDKLLISAEGYDRELKHVSAFEGKVTVTPYTKHYPPNPKAAELYLNRVEGTVAQIIELAAKGFASTSDAFTAEMVKGMSVPDLLLLRDLLMRNAQGK